MQQYSLIRSVCIESQSRSQGRIPYGRADAIGHMATSLLGSRCVVGRAPTAGRSESDSNDLIPWLRLLSDDEQVAVEESIQLHAVQKNDVLVRQGAPVDRWYGVIHGFLSVTHEAASASAVLDTGVPEQGWFGEHYLLAHTVSDCSVIALLEGVVASIPAEKFIELTQEHPKFSQLMLRLQADRLAGIRARLGWPRHMSTDAWVACRLASLFDTRELFNRKFAIRLTQSALSEFLGLSRQRTNMALNSLRMRGGIDQRYGGLRIEDPSRLILLAVNGAF